MVEDDNIESAAETMFSNASRAFDERVQDHQLMCRILFAYRDTSDAGHNCLGCNFNDITMQISNYLSMCCSQADNLTLHGAITIYAFLMNTLWERVTDVFDIVSVPESYRARHYQPLIRIRRWANFFKHPKEFGWLVHHPKYTVEGTSHAQLLIKSIPDSKVINDEFLKKYYSAERSKGLAGEFKGRESRVIVLLPNIEAITLEICECLSNFVNVVTDNPVYREILNDKSTIANFYENLEAN